MVVDHFLCRDCILPYLDATILHQFRTINIVKLSLCLVILSERVLLCLVHRVRGREIPPWPRCVRCSVSQSRWGFYHPPTGHVRRCFTSAPGAASPPAGTLAQCPVCERRPAVSGTDAAMSGGTSVPTEEVYKIVVFRWPLSTELNGVRYMFLHVLARDSKKC